MNMKLLLVVYLIIFAIISVYLPEYIDIVLKYQNQISELVLNSSTAFITKGS